MKSKALIFLLLCLGLTARVCTGGEFYNPPCPSCKGIDRCAMCQGNGAAYGVTCSVCDGTGRCKLCAMLRESRRRFNEEHGTNLPMPPSAASDTAVSTPSPSTPPSQPAQPAPCPHCHGTGKSPTDNLSGGVPTFGNDQGTTYCSICNRTVPKPHVHGPCPVCHGTGKTR